MIHTDGRRTVADNTERTEPRTWQERAEALDPQCGNQNLRYALVAQRHGDGDQPEQRAYFADAAEALRARDYLLRVPLTIRFAYVLDTSPGSEAAIKPVTWGDVCGCAWSEDKCPWRAGDVAGCSAAQGAK